MQNKLKRYAIVIRGKVQNIGYRGIIEGTARIATDEYYEFSRKFDIGLDYLDGIKTDTGDIKGTLGEMKGTLGDMRGSLNSIDNTLETFVTEQREHNQRLDKHNQRLEKILEKLSEKK